MQMQMPSNITSVIISDPSLVLILNRRFIGVSITLDVFCRYLDSIVLSLCFDSHILSDRVENVDDDDILVDANVRTVLFDL